MNRTIHRELEPEPEPELWDSGTVTKLQEVPEQNLNIFKKFVLKYLFECTSANNRIRLRQFLVVNISIVETDVTYRLSSVQLTLDKTTHGITETLNNSAQVTGIVSWLVDVSLLGSIVSLTFHRV